MGSLIRGAQDHALKTPYHQRNIMKQQTDSKCRMCYRADKHMKHSVAGCTTPAPSEYSYNNRHINPLKPELNSICYLLALLAHHFLHVSRIRVKSLTFRRLMSYIYIYGAPILDVSRSHTTTQHSR